MKRNLKVQTQRIVKEKFARIQFPVLTPMNENQKYYFDALKHDTVVVATGSAGSGKTICACYHAARKLHHKDIKKVVLIRAYQPLAGRSIGFLPGTAEEKLIPYYQQLLDYFEDCLGKGTVETSLKSKEIEICSLETIRGRSWTDCIVIVDEAQNLYPSEVQALMTRIGDNCQMIICGDTTQTDVLKGTNGLVYLKQIIDRYNISDTAFIKFTPQDIVRSGMTKEFVLAFEKELELETQGKAILSTLTKNK